MPMCIRIRDMNLETSQVRSPPMPMRIRIRDMNLETSQVRSRPFPAGFPCHFEALVL